MGYTHYYTVEAGRMSDEEWWELTERVDIITAYYYDHSDEELVVLNDDIIQVKGPCEWFVIERDVQHPSWRSGVDGPVFHFTKTNHHDYDKIIVACILALKETLGDRVSISSDGGDEVFTSGAGYEIYQASSDVFRVGQEVAEMLEGRTWDWDGRGFMNTSTPTKGGEEE